MSDVPAKFKTVIRLGLVEQTEAVQKTAGIMDGITVLSGGVGCGKSLAAAVWVGGGMFVSSALLSRWPRYEMAEMRRLLMGNRLVIDDLGTEYMDDKGNFMAVLDECVNDRYSNDRPTMITTNLKAEDFRKRYGDRIADRVRDNGRFISLSDMSRRHAQTAEEKAARQIAEDRVKADAAAAKPKPLCNRCLYGSGECQPGCRQYGWEPFRTTRPTRRQEHSEPMSSAEILASMPNHKP